MSHFIIQCKCGHVLSQCRCPDPNKVTTVETCDVCHPPEGAAVKPGEGTWRHPEDIRL